MGESLTARRKRPADTLLYGLVYFCAFLSVALLALILIYVVVRGVGSVNWQFLTTVTSKLKGTVGIAGNLLNTLMIVVLTMLVALPIGVGAAVYLNEYAKPGKLVSLIEFATETLSGIPSILFGLLGSIFFGIAVAVLMLLFQTPILHLLGARDDTIAYAGAYYRFLVLGCPAIIFNIVPGNLLRTEGLANDAMIGSVIGAVFNIFLDPIFIFSLHMGAGGAALATILSNLLADCYLVWVVFKKAGHLSMSCREMHISSGHVRDILLIGIPASITNLMQSFAVLLTNRFLLPYGSDKVAALGIALKVNMITMLILVGFAFGAQPLLGYCYGADNRERLKQFLHFDLLVQLLIALVFTAAACIFAPHIIRIFMQDDVIVASGALMLRCLMITAPVIGMILVFTTLFQAAGMALPAFLMSISRQGVLLVLCMLLFSSLFGYMGILLAQAVSDVLTGILGFLLLRRSKILL